MVFVRIKTQAIVRKSLNLPSCGGSFAFKVGVFNTFATPSTRTFFPWLMAAEVAVGFTLDKLFDSLDLPHSSGRLANREAPLDSVSLAALWAFAKYPRGGALRYRRPQG